MTTIFVSGLINIETTVQVDRFPIEYSPVRYPFFGVRSTVAGVGYNVAKALATLGDSVRLASIVGRDMPGALVDAQLRADGLPGADVLALAEATAQSAILYDPAGRRQINTDLKDIQELRYPPEQLERALDGCALAALCNINFSRPMLARAKARGIAVATDVHAIGDLDDAYNRDFMAAADLLFMSHELLPCDPEAWAARVQQRYGTPIVVVGLGAGGALLAVRADGFVGRFAAHAARPIVSTIGAGDALFSAFLHSYAAAPDPYAAIQRAIVFAGYKIGSIGAAEGFLSHAALEALLAELPG
ncbi:carbohydrate kinase family protein [Kouleothrix sp.]|uniref:carbohydrate kinase family protein n=1 Tax=Kouleothrix sp. TaxID=2779161 RepID=UPI003918F3FC